MLNKDQALAAMESHIIRAEAEQKRRLERRVHPITVLYPALRSVPLEEREPMVARARAHALRRWTLHISIVAALAVICALVMFREQIIGSRSAFELYMAVLLPMGFLVISFYLHLRSSVKHTVAVRQRLH